MLQFEALLFIGLITAGARLRRGQVIDGLVDIGPGLYGAFERAPRADLRHCDRSMIAVEMTSWWKAWVGDASPKSAAGILNQMGFDLARGFQRYSVWIVAAVAALALSGSAIAWPSDFPANYSPLP